VLCCDPPERRVQVVSTVELWNRAWDDLRAARDGLATLRARAGRAGLLRRIERTPVPSGLPYPRPNPLDRLLDLFIPFRTDPRPITALDPLEPEPDDAVEELERTLAELSVVRARLDDFRERALRAGCLGALEANRAIESGVIARGAIGRVSLG
jgi:hypothetical protein